MGGQADMTKPVVFLRMRTCLRVNKDARIETTVWDRTRTSGHIVLYLEQSLFGRKLDDVSIVLEKYSF